MIWLITAAGFLILMAIAVLTFRAIGRLPSSRLWHRAAVGALLLGLALGVWVNFFLQYRVAPDLIIQGFPLPEVVLHFEDGHWVDFIGLIPLVVPFNVFAVASSCLLPVSLALIVRRFVRTRPDQPEA